MHNNKTIRKVMEMLQGASKAHAGQAKMLRKVLASPMPKERCRVSKKKKINR